MERSRALQGLARPPARWATAPAGRAAPSACVRSSGPVASTIPAPARRPPQRQAVDRGGASHAPARLAGARRLVAAVEGDLVPRASPRVPPSSRSPRLEPAHVDVVEAHGLGGLRSRGRSRPRPRSRELAISSARRPPGTTNCSTLRGDDHAAGIEKPRPRVVERGDDVLLEGIVAERLAHDDVDAAPGAATSVECTWAMRQSARLVVAQELAGDGGASRPPRR